MLHGHRDRARLCALAPSLRTWRGVAASRSSPRAAVIVVAMNAKDERQPADARQRMTQVMPVGEAVDLEAPWRFAIRLRQGLKRLVL